MEEDVYEEVGGGGKNEKKKKSQLGLNELAETLSLPISMKEWDVNTSACIHTIPLSYHYPHTTGHTYTLVSTYLSSSERAQFVSLFHDIGLPLREGSVSPQLVLYVFHGYFHTTSRLLAWGWFQLLSGGRIIIIVIL